MRKPYSHEYGRFVHKFKNTACFTNLTSRILSTARGGNYYGPSEGQYTGRWQYEPRTKCKCRNKQMCDAIREDLYVAATKSSCLIPDQATAWYEKQKQLRNLKKAMKNMSPKELMEYQCHYHGNFKFQSPPSHCLALKTPIRSVSCVPFQVGSAQRMSPEFFELLRQHELRQRQTSVLNCLPANYTKRLLQPQSKTENVGPTCYCGASSCYCGTNMSYPELMKSRSRFKTDTHMDRHKSYKKGFLNRCCFSSEDQTYPVDDPDYCRRQGSLRSLQHYARSQPRLRPHTQCPSEVCVKETCSIRYKGSKEDEGKSLTTPRTFAKAFPKLHGFGADYIADKHKKRFTSEPNLRPRVHKQESIKEIWTKPNATQMRESQASLRPRYFAPDYVESQIKHRKPQGPPIPPKPQSYVLGQSRAPEMTKPPKTLKRKHSYLRTDKSITDLRPRHRVQQYPIAKETFVEDKTCYPHIGPRYIPFGPNAKKFDSRCTKRKRTPREDRKPKWIAAPNVHPRYHKERTISDMSRGRGSPNRSFSETRPRYREIFSDSSRGGHRKGILKSSSREVASFRPSTSHFMSAATYKANKSQATSNSCFIKERYRRKPNADDTTDDTDRENRLPVCASTSDRHPRINNPDMSCRQPDKRRASASPYVRVGTCDIPKRPPSARKYTAPVCILKGHDTCYKESSHWAGIPSNYPRPYLERAKRNQKELTITKNQRLQMWATKECPKPKYAPASKCQSPLKLRCPSNEPHKALYTPRKRLRTRDASPYHRVCYTSSSAGEN